MVLLLRPHLGEQVKAELIETEEDGEGVCNEDVREVNKETTDVTDSKDRAQNFRQIWVGLPHHPSPKH